ncbi:translocation/assembly module TamB domain-containing protein [Pseudohongiella nitratireducens]|uniref:translocation/assembly module TamB domain-containing protein n=1 Tax=Pseudohongiella nitratireducens TaxID=1768907 RepID=UPI0030EB3CBB
MSTAAADTTRKRPELPIWRRVLRWVVRGLGITILVLMAAIITFSGILATNSGSQWLLGRISSLVNSESQTFNYDQADGSFLRGLNLHGVYFENATTAAQVEQIHSRWNPITLLDGEFVLESLRVAGLQLTLTENPNPPPPGPPLVLEELLSSILPLPIGIQLNNIRLDGANITQNGTDFALNSLTFNASLFGRQAEISNLAFEIPEASLNGDISATLRRPYSVEAILNWQYQEDISDTIAAPEGTLELSGNLDTLTLVHQLSGPAELNSNGSVELGLARFLNAETDTINPNLDLTHTLSPMTVPGAEQLAINSFTLTTQGTPDNLGLNANASVDAAINDSLNIQSDIRTQAFLRGSHLDIDSLALETESGQVLIDGRVDWSDAVTINANYSIEDSAPGSYLALEDSGIALENLQSRGQVEVIMPPSGDMNLSLQVPELRVMVNDRIIAGSSALSFDGNRWQLSQFRLNSDDSHIDIQAEMNSDQTIQAAGVINIPDLSAFHPAIAGTIEANANISGNMDAPVIDLDLLASQVQFQDIVIPELTIVGQNRAGMNELELRSGQIQIPVAETTETINDVMLRLRGQPSAHNMLLRVDSSLGEIRINADGELADGDWQGRLLSSVIDTPLGEWQQQYGSQLQFSSTLSRIDDLCWQTQSASLCLSASLEDGDQLAASWQLTEYSLNNFNRIEAERAIDNALPEPRLVDAAEPSNAASSTQQRLPWPLPSNLAINGTISINGEASGSISDFSTLRLTTQISSQAGDLYMLGESVEEEEIITSINQFRWPSLDINAELEDGSWLLQSELQFYQADVEQPDNTQQAMRGRITTDLSMDSDQSLGGNLQLAFDDLGWVEALAPQVSAVNGQLQGRIDVSGNMEQPVLATDIELSDTRFNVPAAGLSISDVNASIFSEDSRQFSINLGMRSGDGQLEINGSLIDPFLESRELSLEINGDDVSVVNLDTLSATASPHVTVIASQQAIDISGEIEIPMVDLTVAELPESAVDVSRDAVIVAQPEEREIDNTATTETSSLAGIPLTSSLVVRLGDNVHVSGFGLNARLEGELDITQRAQATPVAYGELGLASGELEVYGRTLYIEQGKLLFMGSFDNPALDIRAIREVEDMRVGVQINGTARNMRSTLFSTPTLPEGDILAVMITGRPIAEIGSEQDGNALIGAATSLGIRQTEGIVNQIQSQLGLDALSINSSGDTSDSSLMLGKYITPRIFIRYAVGLFETENSLAIDYTMTERIKLQATSGESQSIDVTYTVEQ